MRNREEEGFVLRTVEHTFRPSRPAWIWPLALVCFASAAVAAFAVELYVAIGPAVMGAVILAARAGQVTLEGGRLRSGPDERGVALAQLDSVEYVEFGYYLKDSDGAETIVQLDGVLRSEVSDAAYRRGLVLSTATQGALLAGRQGTQSPKVVVAVVAIALLLSAVPAIAVGLIRDGSDVAPIDVVDGEALADANNGTGARHNPFAALPARELYLVGHGVEALEQLPALASALEARFGMYTGITAPLSVDSVVLDPSRGQLDSWKLTGQLLSGYPQAHGKRAAIAVAVTELDLYNSREPRFGFLFMLTRWTGGGRVCVAAVSTARLGLGTRRADQRLVRLAARGVGRCLGLEQPGTVNSLDDVDRLDDHAGADLATIRDRVAEWRAFFSLPEPPRLD